MVRVSQESRDTQTRGVEAGELYPSRDCPGMVRVSQESRDTQTRGGRGRRAVSIPGLSWDGQSIPGIPGYSDKGGRGRRAISIPGLSWDGQSIPEIPGYSDKGGRGRRAISIPGLSWDGQSIPGNPGYSDKGGDQSIPRVSVYCDEGSGIEHAEFISGSSRDHTLSKIRVYMLLDVCIRIPKIPRTSFKDYRHSAGLLDIPAIGVGVAVLVGKFMQGPWSAVPDIRSIR